MIKHSIPNNLVGTKAAVHFDGRMSHLPIVSHEQPTLVLESHLAALKAAVKQENHHQIAGILRQMATEVHDTFSQYLLALAEAVETFQWDEVGEYFVNSNFIFGRTALLIAPYRRRINGEDVIKLTLIVGKVGRYAPASMEEASHRVFKKLNQPIPKLLPINILASEGNIGGQEAFIAPGGWVLPHSEEGPSILCENLHLQRYDYSIRQRIQRIFESDLAELILSAISDPHCVVQEYYQHEAGHAQGMGLDLKIQLGLVNTPQQAGLEEYKTDITGFRLATDVFPPESVGKLIACTFNIRFGIDFCRPGAPTNDHDALSCLLILDRLLQSDEVHLTEDRRLALRDVSFEGLFKATEIHRLEAEELVRQELDRLENPQSILAFYEGKTASSEVIALHQEFIKRCQDTPA